MAERWATFLFTDIAGSTRLWETFPGTMDGVLALHDQLLCQVIESQHGRVFKTVGDALYAAFETPLEALQAAVDGQRVLQKEEWQGVEPLQVRMALHTGAAIRREGDFYGPTLNRLSRFLAAGHGGQILLSQVVADALSQQMPSRISLRDLGQHRLKDLSHPEHIFQVVAPGLKDQFPPLQTLDLQPHNLPTAVSGFIGRQKELEEVRGLVGAHRLVTLTGSAGTGKTRLALQAAAESLGVFLDGVFFVPLAAIRNPDQVPKAAADALGVSVNERETVFEALVRVLRDRHVLLLLDNFEQVYQAGLIVGELLAAVPQLHVLATSRQRLDIYGEYEYPVPVLQVPKGQGEADWLQLAGNEAVELFIQRAAAARPVYALAPEDAADIAEICRRLDGLPLAIELAAARMRYFSIAAIRQRLHSRLQFLAAGPRDVPARQQTMRQAIDWSYQLLDPGEQAQLVQLGVFVDGWSLEAAEAVVADAGAGDGVKSRPLGAIELFEGLSSLVDKSLIRMHDTPGGEARFDMLGTIREFALEKLEDFDDPAAVHRRHLIYFTFLVEKEDSPSGQLTTQARQLLAAEYGNITAALEWAFESHGADRADDKNLATHLVLAMCNFWYLRGFLDEGRRWLEMVLDWNQEPDRMRARALVEKGLSAWQLGDYTVSQEALEEGVEIFRQLDDRAGLARSLHFAGHLFFDRLSYAQADVYFNESRGLYLDLEDPTLSLILLADTGMVAYHQGDRQTARDRFEMALKGLREQGADNAAADQLNRLGDIARLDQDLNAAKVLYEESLAIFRKNEDSLGVASCWHKLGQVCLRQADYHCASSLLQQSLALQQQAGNKQGIAECLAAYAGLACGLDRCELAARLSGITASFLDELGAPLSPADRHDLDLVHSEMTARLGEQQFQKLHHEGCSMSLDDGIALIQGLEDLF